jgi:DNA-binding CsgD family transcriptional regulator
MKGPRRRIHSPVDPALGAALHHIQVPAFVLSKSGRIIAANGAGRLWLESHDRAALENPDGPDRELFEVTLSNRGAMRYCLVVLRGESPFQASAIPSAWQLTPREHDVVRLVARGASNYEIATELRCAVRTVEHHVTSILRKADVTNRAALIVALMGQSSPMPHS